MDGCCFRIFFPCLRPMIIYPTDRRKCTFLFNCTFLLSPIYMTRHVIKTLIIKMIPKCIEFRIITKVPATPIVTIDNNLRLMNLLICAEYTYYHSCVNVTHQKAVIHL